MRAWSAERVGREAGARVLRSAPTGPLRAVIDSREAGPGDLFVGLRGERADGGAFAAPALAAGAWGVLVAPAWAEEALASPGDGAVLVADAPLTALGALARGWRRELGAQVIGITGSVGKTSTKDLLAGLLAPHRRVAASRANFNTEIGMPLELLAAPPGTEVLVLELAMRGFGQIAELTAICEPDVGVITNIGPVHLELVGSLDGVARAKGELLQGLREGATAVVPAGEARLAPYLPRGGRVLRFGPGGDVALAEDGLGPLEGEHRALRLRAGGEEMRLEVPARVAQQVPNVLAAVAAALAVGVRPEGGVEVAFSALRGERVALGLGAVLINDCYNANPLSMRAALENLAAEAPEGRRVAILGDMLELGPDELEHHREAGREASRAGVGLLVAVGPRAAAMLDRFDGEAIAVPDAAAASAVAAQRLAPGDVVLVKGSRGVGLEAVAEALLAAQAQPTGRGSP